MPLTQVQQPQASLSQSDRPIIFFDGDCVMCNTFVDLMLQIDPEARVRLAPLQGETAQRLLPPLPNNRREWTIYYLDETGLCDRSEAVIKICQRLESWVSVLSWARFISLPIRDLVYNWVAYHRYDWFGQRDTCRVPTAQEQDRFLP